MSVDAYIRVSDVRGRKGESFISPDVQREQIELWARSRGLEVGEVFVELDESGARSDRPMLMAAIERIEAGVSKGVVVAKLDRFGRSLLDGLSAIERIEEAGGTFVSVQDGFDLATPTGRLMLRMMLAWAEWELERIRINADIACERAVARGIYVAWKGPPGYVRGADGRLEVDPERAAPIVEAFRLRANGASAREVADFLNRSSFTTQSGQPIRVGSIYPIIRNRAYLGESHHGRHVNPCAHVAIIDPNTWRQAQFPATDRFDGKRALLAKAIRCASCGRSMVSYAPETKRFPSAHYRCYVANGPRPCPGPAAVAAEQIEPLVEDFVVEQAAAEPHMGSQMDFSNLAARWPGLSVEQRKLAIAEVVDWVAVERGRGPISERAWLCLVGRHWRPQRWNEPIRPFDPTRSEAVRLPMPKSWSEARIEEGLERLLAGAREWPTFAQFAEAGFARLHFQAMGFGGPYWWGPRFGIEVPEHFVIWNEERVRGALRPFLRGREMFPTKAEFIEAQLHSLWSAVDSHGAVEYWADEFGLVCENHSRTWSKEKIRRELDGFLAGREHYPSQKEFAEAGKMRLFNAIRRRGGPAYWQRRFELEPPVWNGHGVRAGPAPTNELARRSDV